MNPLCLDGVHAIAVKGRVASGTQRDQILQTIMPKFASRSDMVNL
jgi:hypothetical protein